MNAPWDSCPKPSFEFASGDPKSQQSTSSQGAAWRVDMEWADGVCFSSSSFSACSSFSSFYFSFFLDSDRTTWPDSRYYNEIHVAGQGLKLIWAKSYCNQRWFRNLHHAEFVFPQIREVVIDTPNKQPRIDKPLVDRCREPWLTFGMAHPDRSNFLSLSSNINTVQTLTISPQIAHHSTIAQKISKEHPHNSGPHWHPCVLWLVQRQPISCLLKKLQRRVVARFSRINRKSNASRQLEVEPFDTALVGKHMTQTGFMLFICSSRTGSINLHGQELSIGLLLFCWPKAAHAYPPRFAAETKRLHKGKGGFCFW